MMTLYEVHVMPSDGEPWHEFVGSRALAEHAARTALREREGEVDVDRIELLDPAEVGGLRRWTLRILNDGHFIRTRTPIGQWKSEPHGEWPDYTYTVKRVPIDTED